jgi:hypothetical protein
VSGDREAAQLGLTFHLLPCDLHWGCDERHTEVDSSTDHGGGLALIGVTDFGLGAAKDQRTKFGR